MATPKNSMKEKLIKYFKQFDTEYSYYNETKTGFNFVVSDDFFNLELRVDFDTNSFDVYCLVSVEQYSRIFMVDEDEVSNEEVDEWNTKDSFTDIEKALCRCIDILDVVDSEIGHQLDDKKREIFENALTIVHTNDE